MRNYQRLSALDRVKHCVSSLIVTQPFYGCLALGLEIVESFDPDFCDTMAVDGTHLYFYAPYVLSLPERELIGVNAHEVTHCSYGHHRRIGTRDLERANRAADYAINRDLKAAGFTLPKDCLFDARFHGMGFEEIYAILDREDKAKEKAKQEGQQGQSGQPQGQGQQGQSGQNGQPAQAGAQGNSGAPADGSGNPQGQAAGAQGQASGHDGTPAQGNASGGQSGGNGQPSGKPSNAGKFGTGGILPAPAGTDLAADEAKWQIAVRQAAAVAKKHNAGTMPGYLQSIIEDLGKPVIDPRELLENFIDSQIASDYSFAKPNRRYVSSGVYLPSAVVDALAHLVFIIDTSGSITNEMLVTASAIIKGAMDAGKVERCTVIMADTRVAHVQEFEHGEEIELELRGGGGTRFDAALRYVVDNIDDATAIIYLTDMECKHFGTDPEIPLLWAIHSKPQAYDALSKVAPFGDPVYVGQL